MDFDKKLLEMQYEIEKIIFPWHTTYVCMSDSGNGICLVEEFPINYYFFNSDSDKPTYARMVKDINPVKDNDYCLGEL